jgi:O-antigen/teichoic acid export membrane protein
LKNLYNLYLKGNLRAIKRIIVLFFVFGLFKSIAYFAPLGMSKTIDSSETFGEFEYALNLGLMFTGVFSAGLLGAYGYFILKNNHSQLKPIFHFHFITLTALLLVISIINLDILSNNYFGAVIIGIAFADQILIAGILKGEGRNNLAIIIDTGLYIIMAVLVLLMLKNIIEFTHEIWYLSLLLYLFSTSLFYHLPRSKKIFQLDFYSILSVYKFGGLVLLTGPLLVLLASSTRLFINYFSDLENVGIYSIYFRVAAFVLIIYRVVGILLFRSFFVSKHEILDKRYSLLIFALLLFNCLSFFLLPQFLSLINSPFSQAISDNWQLYLLCLFQVSFWINISLFESAFQRENKLKKFILLLIIAVFVLVGTLFLLNKLNLLNLKSIVIINTLIIFLVFYGQQFILKKINITYPKTVRIHSLAGVIYVVAIFFIYFLQP